MVAEPCFSSRVEAGPRPIYAAIGVDLAGHRDVLGMWAGEGDGESAKYWLAVLTELKNRGMGQKRSAVSVVERSYGLARRTAHSGRGVPE